MKYIEELGLNYREPDGFTIIGNWPLDKISDNFHMYGRNHGIFPVNVLSKGKSNMRTGGTIKESLFNYVIRGFIIIGGKGFFMMLS